MNNAEPATGIFFHKRPPPFSNTIHMAMEALSYGKLELKDRCLGFKGKNGSFLTFIGWPSFYDLKKIDDEIFITHNNKQVVKIGEYLKLGGGYDRRRGVEPLVSNGVKCSPPYWVVGNLTVLSFIEQIIYRLN